MAREARVRAVLTQAGPGPIEFQLRVGDGPLPPGADGGMRWSSKAEMVRAVREAARALRENWWAVPILMALRADPTLGATFRARCLDPAPTLDVDDPDEI